MPSIAVLLLLFLLYHFDGCIAKFDYNSLSSRTLLELPEANYFKVHALSGGTTTSSPIQGSSTGTRHFSGQNRRLIYDILQEYERRLNAASGKKNGKEIAQEMDIPYGTILSWIYRKKRGKLSNVPYMAQGSSGSVTSAGQEKQPRQIPRSPSPGLVVTQPGGVQPVPVGVSFPPAFGGVPQQPTNFNPNQYHPLYEQSVQKEKAAAQRIWQQVNQNITQLTQEAIEMEKLRRAMVTMVPTSGYARSPSVIPIGSNPGSQQPSRSRPQSPLPGPSNPIAREEAGRSVAAFENRLLREEEEKRRKMRLMSSSTLQPPTTTRYQKHPSTTHSQSPPHKRGRPIGGSKSPPRRRPSSPRRQG